MNHSYIDEHHIVARYGMRKLSSAERLEFEEHFVECPECQEQLETTEAFRKSLKTVIVEATARSFPAVRSTRSWLQRGGAWQPALIAAGLLILMALPTVVAIREVRAVDGELRRTRRAAEESRQQYAQEHQARTELERSVQERRRQEVEPKSQQPPPAAARSADGPSPPALVSIFALNAVRGANLAGAEPPNRIEISPRLRWVVLSLDLEPDGDVQRYQAVLQDSGGRVLWDDTLSATGPSGAFGISLPSAFFRDGDYLLRLEGLSQEGRKIVSRSYRFRVLITKG